MDCVLWNERSLAEFMLHTQDRAMPIRHTKTKCFVFLQPGAEILNVRLSTLTPIAIAIESPPGLECKGQ